MHTTRLDRLAQVEQIIAEDDGRLIQVLNIISKNVGLPESAILDTLKRRMLLDLAEGRTSIYGSKSVGSRMRGFAALAWLYIKALLSIIVPRRKRIFADVDLLLDYWGADNFSFYEPVIKHLELQADRIGVFSRKLCPKNYPPEFKIIYRPWKSFYSAEAAKNVIRIIPMLLKFQKIHNINLLFVSAVLLQRVASHASDALGFKARVMLSSGDNYFSGIRFWSYRRHSVGCLVLLQNGSRGTQYTDSFIYTDHFFGYGSAVPGLIPGLSCRHFHAVGSLKSRAVLDQVGRSDLDLKIDVAFVEQVITVDLPDSCWIWAYRLARANFLTFAAKHPNIRCCFITRPNREGMEGAAENDAALAGTNVVMSTALGLTSYQAILSSKLITTYNSTLAMEAGGLGTPFIFCNYDNLPFVPNEGEPFFLTDSSYECFERCAFELLSPSHRSIKTLNSLGERYMVSVPDAPLRVAKVIGAELGYGSAPDCETAEACK